MDTKKIGQSSSTQSSVWSSCSASTLPAGFILTNICNNLVIAILMQPVLAAFSASSGMDTTVVCMMMMYTILGTAFITPAASPFSAIPFCNKDWLVNFKHT